jgi:choline dehydrogenase-like flavoprotein
MTEDLPNPNNRVTLTRDRQVKVTMDYTNTKAHLKLLKTLGDVLRKAGYPLILTEVMDVATCSHQVGTLKFDHDPIESVLDTFCRSHDLKNLFVVDASFFPSSSAVNPALTIMAQALRVGKWMRETY